MLAYLRGGSAQRTVLKLQIDEAWCLTHSPYTDTGPAGPITDLQAPGRVATGVPDKVLHWVRKNEGGRERGGGGGRGVIPVSAVLTTLPPRQY